MTRFTRSRFIKRRQKYYRPALVLMLGLVLILLITELTNTTHLFHKSSTPPVIPVTPSPSSPTSTSGQSGGQGARSSKDTVAGDSHNDSAKASLPLYKPYGDFVSNHHPNLDGSPAPSQEASVCNTTPGAKCYISFTKGSVTTHLPAQTTDAKGVSYWNWDVKKAGLTPGNWTVTAVASLNGQTKTTTDPLLLEVNQ